MTPEEWAGVLVSEARALWPKASEPKSAVVMESWFPSLAMCEAEDMRHALRILAEGTSFFPTLNELLMAVREVRNVREQLARPKLPAPAPNLPGEVQAQMRAGLEAWIADEVGAIRRRAGDEGWSEQQLTAALADMRARARAMWSIARHLLPVTTDEDREADTRVHSRIDEHARRALPELPPLRTPTLEDTARELADAYQREPSDWPPERIAGFPSDVRNAVREELRRRKQQVQEVNR